MRLYPKDEPEGEQTYEQGFKDGVRGFYPRIFGNRSITVYHDGYWAGLDELRKAKAVIQPPSSATISDNSQT